MKISYITTQFPVPSQTFLSLDVEALRNQGHEVSIYGLRPKHKRHSQLMLERGHEGLVVENSSFKTLVLSLWFCLRHPLMFLSLFYWVVKVSFKTPKHLLKSLVFLPSVMGHFYAIYQSKPDVVHLFWGHYPSMLGYLVKRFMPAAVVSQFLGAYDLVTNYPGSAALAKEADLLFTHSKSNLPMFDKMGIDSQRVHVVLRGTKLDFPYEGRLDKFDTLDAPIFLTAGRLEERKGIDDVLRVFSSVVKEYADSHLYIAGDGPYKNELILLSQELGCSRNVSFLGHIKQVDLIQLMSTAHFFLLLSRSTSERLPNVVKEAMYQQCIVITTDTDGISELVDAGKNGFVVPMSSYEDAYKAVNRCLISPVTSVEKAKLAKEKIIEGFNVNKSMTKYVVLWKNSLNKLVK